SGHRMRNRIEPWKFDLVAAAMSFFCAFIAFGAGMALTRTREALHTKSEFMAACLVMIALIGAANALVTGRFTWLALILGSAGFGIFMILLVGARWRTRDVIGALELISWIAIPFAAGSGLTRALSRLPARR